MPAGGVSVIHTDDLNKLVKGFAIRADEKVTRLLDAAKETGETPDVNEWLGDIELLPYCQTILAEDLALYGVFYNRLSVLMAKYCDSCFNHLMNRRQHNSGGQGNWEHKRTNYMT